MSDSRTSLPWDKAVLIFENIFGRMGVDSFQNVLIDGGRAHQVYSTEETALLIQPFQGMNHFRHQCEELLLLRKRLMSLEETDVNVLPAIYFSDSSEAHKIASWKGIAKITPNNMGAFKRYFTRSMKRRERKRKTEMQ